VEFDRPRQVNLEKIVGEQGLGLLDSTVLVLVVKVILLFLLCSLLGFLGRFFVSKRRLEPYTETLNLSIILYEALPSVCTNPIVGSAATSATHNPHTVLFFRRREAGRAEHAGLTPFLSTNYTCPSTFSSPLSLS